MKSNINRHTAALMKKFAGISLVIILGLVGFLPNTAEARLLFTTEDDGVNSDAYHLDNDDSSADFIDLGFGTGLGSRLRYDIVGSQFLLNQDLNLEGNALEDFRIENAAAALACAAPADRGRMYYNTTSDDLFFCDGANWVSTSTSAAGLAGAGLVVNGTELDVNVDDSTIEINADVVRVKDLGITETKLAANAVTTGKIAAGAVELSDMAANSVNSAKIVNESILSEDILNGTISADDLGTDSVDSDEIAASAVGTAEIANTAVTVAKIGTAGAGDALKFLTTDAAGVAQWELKSNFMSSALADGSMWIGDGTGTATAVAMSGDVTMTNAGVTTVGANKILTGMIAAGAVELSDMAANSVNSAKIVNESILSEDILNGTISADDLGTDSVDSDEIAADAVGSSEIAANAVGTSELNATGTGNDKRLTTNGTGDMVWIDDNNLDDTLTSANIFVGNGSNVATGVAMSGDATMNNTGALTIGANKILTGMIAAGAVELSDMAANSVNSAKIVNESILSEDILNGTISADDLGTDSVDSDEIAANAVDTSELNASGVGNNKTLTTDGAGAMVWVDNAAVSREVSAHVAPEFSNFTLATSGANGHKGSLESDHADNRNFYKWKTRKTGAMQDYDVVFQWMVPDDFQSWSTTANPIEVDYKTDTTVATDNKLDITMNDTANAAVTLDGTASGIVSAVADTWATAVVDSSIAAGTFTPGEYVTITIKMSSKATTTANRNPAYLGAFTFNYVAK